ncbi:SigB/SigF/SigG family RNA polymerase sigma factor [Streptomyces katsurahamanus]|uniref:SigB/SigF/SigG family RNA polymerase sigma factor n=1 Tax=Streptomyces katsurahamanus TaxID=2577098 RepID=A0ABW9P1D1_9ACTN|nr:SigB/SigF/SigG family RNA polymerase sigma factor [Streptomyces katsurahamanus]MQS38844.1 SigB/SigF/SigG family RNA polymerase sigma factor [Streptomyces katsurahamanus]
MSSTGPVPPLIPAPPLRTCAPPTPSARTARPAGPGGEEPAGAAEPSRASTVDARQLSVSLFRRLAALEEGTAEYAYVRNTLVELNLSLVRFAARRFRGRAESDEDVVQVGTIGLIKAINRFDPARGVDFASFAMPTIAGEMKRFFRDTGWAVRVPRRLQELRIALARATDALEQELGRHPSTAELAERLGISEKDAAEGERAASGYTARSLDAPAADDDGPGTLTHRLGAEEEAYELVECLASLGPLISELDERDRLVLSLRFGAELTQAEIGARLGVSQMQVSRLLTRILDRLRAGLLQEGPA